MIKPGSECVHLHCTSTAVYRLTAPGRICPWLACQNHMPDMQKALSIGHGFQGEADVQRITARRTP